MLNFYNQSQPPNKDVEKEELSEGLKKIKIKTPDFKQYTDPTGEFGSKELVRAEWYLRHKVTLYKITVGFLIAVIAVTGVFSLWRWGDYLIFGITNDAKLMNDLSNFNNSSALLARFSPQPLQILQTTVFSSGVNKFDLVSEIANPNDRFLVTFDYYFSVDGKETSVNQAVLLPRESRPVVFLGLSSTGYPNVEGIVIENINWQRISNHDVSDTVGWQNSHLNFLVSDFSFSQPELNTIANANIVRFTIINQSPYGYKTAKFLVGLYSGDSLVGVAPIVLENFLSNESRVVDWRNYVNNVTVDGVKLFPLINIYDSETYLTPGS